MLRLPRIEMLIFAFVALTYFLYLVGCIILVDKLYNLINVMYIELFADLEFPRWALVAGALSVM